jgi:hypothetical protein
MGKIVAVGAAICSVLALTGCVEIQSDSGGQPDGIGDVVITTTICRVHATLDCADDTNDGRTGDDRGQLLVAYRVPETATAPDTVAAARTGAPVLLTKNDGYSQFLNVQVSLPAGERWVGYASPYIEDTGADSLNFFTVTARFSVLRKGSFVPAEFTWKTIAGYRQTASSAAVERPVHCATPPTAAYLDPGPSDGPADDVPTRCIDTPKAPAHLETFTIALNDAVVRGGDAIAATQGATLAVPFEVEGQGTPPELAVTATTSMPGATVTPAQPAYTPTATKAQLPVSLVIADDTPAGTYDVKLTLTKGAATRSATRQVVVAAKPPPVVDPGPQQPPAAGDAGPQQQPSGGAGPLPPPSITTSPSEPNIAPVLTAAFAKGQKHAKALKRGVKLSASCSEGCSWTLTVTAGRTTVATGNGSRTAPGKFTALAKFTKAAQKKYKKAKKLKLAAVFEATDAGGLKAKKTARITIPR